MRNITVPFTVLPSLRSRTGYTGNLTALHITLLEILCRYTPQSNILTEGISLRGETFLEHYRTKDAIQYNNIWLT